MPYKFKAQKTRKLTHLQGKPVDIARKLAQLICGLHPEKGTVVRGKGTLNPEKGTFPYCKLMI